MVGKRVEEREGKGDKSSCHHPVPVLPCFACPSEMGESCLQPENSPKCLRQEHMLLAEKNAKAAFGRRDKP